MMAVHPRHDRKQRPVAGQKLLRHHLAALGGKSGEMDARDRLIYADEGNRLMITKPIDGEPATAANGGRIGTPPRIPNMFWRGMPPVSCIASRPHLQSVRMGRSSHIFAIRMEINSR